LVHRNLSSDMQFDQPLENWDVIVVGAGPAGSALARRLQPLCKVLLLERKDCDASESPRIGESLPGAAKVLLNRLGVLESFLNEGHAERRATISTWERDDPVYLDSMRDPNGPGWHLDRKRFDAGLRAAAVEAGATLLEGCGQLQVKRSDDRWQILLEDTRQVHQAKILVDATGQSANLARQLGISRHVDDPMICLYAYLSCESNDDDHCTRISADHNGWWYSVRVPSGHRMLAFHLDSADPELKTLRRPDYLLAKARELPILAEALVGYMPAPVYARPAASAKLDLDAMVATDPGFFAIGDALLSFDPIASQGLFHALASAESAARAILQCPQEMVSARVAFLDEMRAVHRRYRQHLNATYAGVVRFRNEPFWSIRRGFESRQLAI